MKGVDVGLYKVESSMTFPLGFLLPRVCRGDLFECFLRKARILFFFNHFFLICSHFRRSVLRFKIYRYCLTLTQTHIPALGDEAIFTCPKSFVSTCSEISCSFVMFECICCSVPLSCLNAFAAPYSLFDNHCSLLSSLTTPLTTLTTDHCSHYSVHTADHTDLLKIT